MYEGFERFEVQTSDPEVRIVGRRGGKGPGLLLVHGNPLTHVTWHKIAPRLAEHYTVVATDLRGYGDSSKPRGRPDHSNYTFQRMGLDQVEVMEHFGFKEFFLVGHDRGARTAFRMALDHPERVRKFASIDIVPTHHVWTAFPRGWALHSYHWMFMAQPYDFPERLLSSNLEYYMKKKLEKHMHGQGGLEPEAVAEYIRCCTPEQIHGVCEDYRAAATIDFEMDTKDFEAGNRIRCPVLVLWGAKSHVEQHFKPREVWPQYAANIAGFEALPAGHYPQEQAPEETYRALSDFLRA
ncbi:MAG: alpha/beta hydrolase [Betaproteobacteria bacterium]|nr:MAG: alpha/beta hydrolase [Betaproteobacteria bacterium]